MAIHGLLSDRLVDAGDLVSGILRNALALYYVDRSYGVEIPTEIKHGVFYSLLNVAVAAWLILGARGVGRVFRWAQNAGLNRPSN